MPSIRQMWPRQRFDPETEAQFQESWLHNSTRPLRILITAGIVIYLAVFTPFDYLALPFDHFVIVAGIRVGTVVVLAGILALTYTRHWGRWWQPAMAGAVLIAAAGNGLMNAFSPGEGVFDHMLAPSMLVYVMIAFWLARLTTAYALGTGVGLIVIYNVVMVPRGTLTPELLIGNNVLLFSALILGVLGAHAFERFVRSDYLHARQLEEAYARLKAAQARLVHQEKLASLGSLTAGIAHEIKNPLNFILNFAQSNRELTEELEQNVAEGTNPEAIHEVSADIAANAALIMEHGRRADRIVQGMLNHSRSGGGTREIADLNALVEEHVALAYHGERARVKDFECTVETDLDASMPPVEVAKQDIGRVLLNLLSNAFHAVQECRNSSDPDYMPVVRVSTARRGDVVEIEVSDNGTGIPEDVRQRVFEPFFTTKPPGEGTGFGLSLSYDIVVQGHGGSLTVETGDDAGASFVVQLPIGNPAG